MGDGQNVKAIAAEMMHYNICYDILLFSYMIIFICILRMQFNIQMLRMTMHGLGNIELQTSNGFLWNSSKTLIFLSALSQCQGFSITQTFSPLHWK